MHPHGGELMEGEMSRSLWPSPSLVTWKALGNQGIRRETHFVVKRMQLMGILEGQGA